MEEVLTVGTALMTVFFKVEELLTLGITLTTVVLFDTDETLAELEAEMVADAEFVLDKVNCDEDDNTDEVDHI